MGTQKLWAQVIGVVLLLVGILGFAMDSPLLGFFGVNAAHSVVHLLTGAIFAWAGFSKKAPTKAVNQWLGVVYILVGIVGFFGVLSFLGVGPEGNAGDIADNYLHLAIGIVSALIGWMAK